MPDLQTAFLQDPDQPARRAELAAFVGPHPEKFLKLYDTMVAVANRPAGTRPQVKFFDGGFCWPAFFLGPVWMFYRKMWLWAAGFILLAIVIGFLPFSTHGVGIGLSAGLAVGGFRLYLATAISKVSKLRAQGASLQQIAQAGGVSPLAGWLSGAVFLLLILAGAYVSLNAPLR